MIKVGGVVDDALLYPLEPAYSGTLGHKEGVRRLVAAGELLSGRRHNMAGKIKFQIGHLSILVPKCYCFCIKPSVFVY